MPGTINFRHESLDNPNIPDGVSGTKGYIPTVCIHPIFIDINRIILKLITISELSKCNEIRISKSQFESCNSDTLNILGRKFPNLHLTIYFENHPFEQKHYNIIVDCPSMNIEIYGINENSVDMAQKTSELILEHGRSIKLSSPQFYLGCAQRMGSISAMIRDAKELSPEIHNTLVSIIMALHELRLPSFVLMWIIDKMNYHTIFGETNTFKRTNFRENDRLSNSSAGWIIPDVKKLRLIESVYRSCDNIRAKR